jgi:DNA integrity scanning protein DisA with diadenylate cyclase activity
MNIETIILIILGLIVIIIPFIFLKRMKALFEQFNLKQEITESKKDYIKELTDQIRRELEKSQKHQIIKKTLLELKMLKFIAQKQ